MFFFPVGIDAIHSFEHLDEKSTICHTFRPPLHPPQTPLKTKKTCTSWPFLIPVSRSSAAMEESERAREREI